MTEPLPVDWSQLDREVERVRAEAAALDAERERGKRDVVAALNTAAGEHRAAIAAIDQAVQVARAAGVSWTLIGRAVGLSRSAAYERWNRR